MNRLKHDVQCLEHRLNIDDKYIAHFVGFPRHCASCFITGYEKLACNGHPVF